MVVVSIYLSKIEILIKEAEICKVIYTVMASYYHNF
jgi:hypothetical protein